MRVRTTAPSSQRLTAPRPAQATARTRSAPVAILALQRSIGNHATSALIQRAQLERKEVKQWASWAKAEHNALLAILNALARDNNVEMNPADGFTSVARATTALKTAGVIDDEDIEALQAEIRIAKAGGADKERLVEERDRVRLDAERDATRGKWGHHIFEGDTDANGVPTGYHHQAVASATHEAYGNRTAVGNGGAYQQSVRLRAGGRTRKPIQSTFFPDTVTQDDVIDAITSVQVLRYTTVRYPAALKGMRLKKKGATIFPDGGDDRRGPE